MPEQPFYPPEIPPTPAPGTDLPEPERIEVVLRLPEQAAPSATVEPRLVAPIVYALTLANLVGLWVARGVYVTGFDLFGSSAGVLALHQEGFVGALRKFGATLFVQRGRMRATGDESLLYAFVPGLLNGLTPSLFWGHVLALVLFAASALWVARRLDLRPALVCACILASPAMMSFSIMAFPFLASATVPFALALGHVLPESRRRGSVGALALDVAVFALITFIAFNGYQSGQVFFVVTAIAALTLPQVHWTRRVSWLAASVLIAWLVYTNQAAPTTAALAAVPGNLWAAVVEGVGIVTQRYLLDWYIDFPALLIAAIVAVFVLPRHRIFWASLLAIVFALCSLSAFQFGGALFGPRRVMPFLFVAAVATATALSEPEHKGRGRLILVGLVAAGIAYTSYRTVTFATAKTSDELRNYNVDRVYSLPYAYSGIDMQIWRDRIHDAHVLAGAMQQGPEQHVFFYGFSAIGEDGVNPQLFISRLLLPLGYRRFVDQAVFFDNQDHNLIDLPLLVHPLAGVSATLQQDVRVPFFVHVKEPEHDGPSIVAEYLNGARVTRVDLGLEEFRSYRVDAYRAPGAIPVVGLGAGQTPPGELRDGLCRTTWRQDAGGYSPLVHWYWSLAKQLDVVSADARRQTDPSYYIDVLRRRDPAVVADRPAPTSTTHLRGFLWNPAAETPARLSFIADDEIAVVINGQTVLESLGPKREQPYTVDVVLPAGLSELVIGHHKFGGAPTGVLSFSSTDRTGQPVQWTCPAGFPS